jgi:hypothetical protein
MAKGARIFERIRQFQLGIALVLRAGLDAWTGLQTRDAGWLASAESSARMAFALLGRGLRAA